MMRVFCTPQYDNILIARPCDEAWLRLARFNDVEQLLENVSRMIRSGNFSNADEYLVEGNAIKSRISQIRHKQQDQIQKLDSNIRTTLLYLSTLQETQELVSMARHLLRASKRFQVS